VPAFQAGKMALFYFQTGLSLGFKSFVRIVYDEYYELG